MIGEISPGRVVSVLCTRRLPTVRSIVPAMLLVLAACTPTVKVATDEPITINFNVNIKHEILIKIEKEVEEMFEDEELF